MTPGPPSTADPDLPNDVTDLLADEDVSVSQQTIELSADDYTATEDDKYTHRLVGCAVRKATGELLLVKHGDPDRAGWVIPGGAVEPGETFADAAHREIMEATGIQCEIQRVIAVIEQDFHHAEDPTPSTTGYFVLFGAIPRSEGIAADLGNPEEDIRDADWFTSLPAKTPQPDLLSELFSGS